MVGRGEEGQKYIDEALKQAAQINVPWTTKAEALNALGDSYFYRGDYSSARQQYQRALQTAGKASTDQSLRAQLGVAQVDLAQGHAAPAAPALKKIMQDANSTGLRALSVQASLSYAQALLAVNNAEAAKQELGSALGQTDKLGLLLERARGEYLLGNALMRTGRPKEAPLHYREAERILNSIVSKEEARPTFWSVPISRACTAMRSRIRVPPSQAAGQFPSEGVAARVLRNEKANSGATGDV